jgi:hypothetical protein
MPCAGAAASQDDECPPSTSRGITLCHLAIRRRFGKIIPGKPGVHIFAKFDDLGCAWQPFDQPPVTPFIDRHHFKFRATGIFDKDPVERAVQQYNFEQS